MTESTLVATSSQRRALATIAVGQLFALSLWFSASAVAPQLRDLWRLDTGQEAGLTLGVQLGFVVGALFSAIFNLADVIPSRRLFLISAVGGALANLG
ncbi:MAG: MFS transporter, partial [Acidobacteria bacterium]